MATARRTGTNESVSTYGGGTRNYTVLATWEDATDVDMVTATTSYVLECYNDASSYNDYVNPIGGTTNSSYFRIIRPAAGSGTNGANFHSGNPANGVRFFSTTDADVFRLDENFFQLQDIVAKVTINSANSRDTVCTNATTVQGVRFIGVLVCDSANAGVGACNGITLSNGRGNGAIDCLAHNNDQHGISIIMQQSGYTNFAYNVTATNNGATNVRVASTVSGGTAMAKNCVGSDGVTNDFARAGGTSGTVDVSYCSSKDATADDWGGAGNRVSQTFTFRNAAGDDFHLAMNDAGAKGFGTSLAADGTFAFDDDIDKQTLAGAWSIGFHSSMIKTLQGIALASVKTIQGLAIASVKKLQGLP